MKAITKVIIFIAGISTLAFIVGAGVYLYKNGVPHTGLIKSESSKQNITPPVITNDTSPRTVVPEPTTISDLDEATERPKRAKRAVIFRPLFVYRQQQIKKQRLSEMREQQYLQQMSTTTQRPKTQKPKYASNYPYTTG